MRGPIILYPTSRGPSIFLDHKSTYLWGSNSLCSQGNHFGNSLLGDYALIIIIIITIIITSLHWLPVSYRIRFKVLLLTYKALNDLSPEYISELLNKPKYTHNLRSQSQHLLSVPKSRTVTYGDRAFSVCAPKLWNELPFQLRMSSNIQAFKSGLKTMLFKMAYL